MQPEATYSRFSTDQPEFFRDRWFTGSLARDLRKSAIQSEYGPNTTGLKPPL